jgi:fucose 4-O-acetylase-like acetyltransferase
MAFLHFFSLLFIGCLEFITWKSKELDYDMDSLQGICFLFSFLFSFSFFFDHHLFLYSDIDSDMLVFS